MKRCKRFCEIRKKYQIVFSKSCGYFVIIRKDRVWALGGYKTRKDASNKLDRIVNDIINLENAI